MKHFIVLLVASFTSLISYGQTTVSFTYDDSGNRTSRNTIGLKSASSTEEEKTFPESFSEQLGDQTILIYPNPVESELTVNIQGYEANSSVDISVYDKGGRLVMNQVITSDKSILNLSYLPSGNYFMNIRIGNKATQWKIVKD
jgi:YD repeat-containing protein